jgi:LuxR family maltose regulon positive regulatory protein
VAQEWNLRHPARWHQPGDGETIVVLDDYHVIDAQQVHGSLMFLVRHLPPGLRLVLAGRSDPPLPLTGLRVRGQLAELRADELRFAADEAAALPREAIGADLPGDVVAALAARTEGWAVGLQLAGLSLRGRADAARFVAAFGGSHRYVLDFLTEEVLDRQSQRVRAFLLETSVLERLSGALCDAVTGSSGGHAMLEQVERAGLFLTPLDEVHGHHLFADLLRARLQHEQPDRAEALHRAAAAWHEERGLADDAVRHALAAGDPAWAARLIDAISMQYSCRAKGQRSSGGSPCCPPIWPGPGRGAARRARRGPAGRPPAPRPCRGRHARARAAVLISGQDLALCGYAVIPPPGDLGLAS